MSSVESIQTVLGLTGSFGSGCSTLAKVLHDKQKFEVMSLSKFVKEEWLKNHPGKNVDEALREELQDIGDYLRANKGPQVLAEMAYIDAKNNGKLNQNLVFDSIRNTSEVDFLRKNFHNFFLIAVDCPEKDRWSRSQKRYLGNYLEFLKDEGRDRNEEGLHGQQVSLCVDDADFLISNENDAMLRTRAGWEERLNEKFTQYIDIVRGEVRNPSDQEIYMSMAYTASLMSHCFKRQVGAVIVDKMGKVVSIGYNDNPTPLSSCVSAFYGCFRDGYIDEVMKSLKYCPNCGEKLENFRPPYLCTKCKENLQRQVLPDRALGRCSALHAEERAIIDAGRHNLLGCTIFVTAFPCFTCAQKILDTGINTVWYAESYPDVDGLRAFQKAGEDKIKLEKFQGVKARAYFRLFPQWRSFTEKYMLERRMRQWK
jgi:deoxycytidylate deaminase